MNDGLIRMANGRHQGELITRVPVSYLRWMVSINHSMAQAANDELQRRGTSTPTIECSHHAIDRASQRTRKIWHETKKDDEGLCSWLHRVAAEARELGDKRSGGVYKYMGMKFKFNEELAWPVLLTVMRLKK